MKRSVTALYMETIYLCECQVVIRVLREMAVDSQSTAGLSYKDFRRRFRDEAPSRLQPAALAKRLDLLESFMYESSKRENELCFTEDEDEDEFETKADSLNRKARDSTRKRDLLRNAWSFKAGSLTVVDLSCPLIDKDFAYVLLGICLEIFLESQNGISKIVALDEAHEVSPATTLIILKQGKESIS